MERTFCTFSTDIFRRGSNNIKCEVNLENFYPGACKFSFFFSLCTVLDISHTVVYIGKCVFFLYLIFMQRCSNSHVQETSCRAVNVWMNALVKQENTHKQNDALKTLTFKILCCFSSSFVHSLNTQLVKN